MFKVKFYGNGKSRFLCKQHSFNPMLPHQGTLRSAILWWVRNKNRHCNSFCPTCCWYYRCQEDISIEDLYDDFSAKQIKICGTSVYLQKGSKKHDRH